MPRKKSVAAGGRSDINPNTPAQDDEEDILSEAEAEPSEDGGFVVSEEKVRELGALDTTAIQENRRLNEITGKKRANAKGVSFNTGDVLSTYDQLLRSWPANTLSIQVRRLTGAPVQAVIPGRPRNSAELFEALMRHHGQQEEAEYEVKFSDLNTKQYRSIGKIVLPDTRFAQPPVGQQPMNYYQPPGYQPPPPGYGQPPTPSAYGAPPSPAVPPGPPVVVQAQQPPDMLANMRELMAMFQAFQAQIAPPQQPAATPPPVYMPPPPPQGATLQDQMAWMAQAIEFAKSMQPAQQPAPAPAPAPAPVPAASLPPAPPGMVATQFGFIPMKAFARAMLDEEERSSPPPYRAPRPYQDREREQPGRYAGRGDPPPVSPQYGQGREYPPPYGRSPHAYQTPTTPEDPVKSAMSVLRQAMSTAQEIRRLVPSDDDYDAPPPADAPSPVESPVQVVDTGHGKIVLDKEGNFRPMDTLVSNLGPIMKWAGEQREAIQTRAERRIGVSPASLPPDYVEVSPGYRPPPGYVAVPVDPRHPPVHYAPSSPSPAHSHPLYSQPGDLPPPPHPEHLPPPIDEDVPPNPWGLPPNGYGG